MFRLVCFSLMLSPKKLCKDTTKFCALRIIEQNKHDFCIFEVQIKKGEKSQGANKLGVSYPFEQHLMRFPSDSHRFSAIISEQVRHYCPKITCRNQHLHPPRSNTCRLLGVARADSRGCKLWALDVQT